MEAKTIATQGVVANFNQKKSGWNADLLA